MTIIRYNFFYLLYNMFVNEISMYVYMYVHTLTKYIIQCISPHKAKMRNITLSQKDYCGDSIFFFLHFEQILTSILYLLA